MTGTVFVLVLQHHLLDAPTRIVAPLVPGDRMVPTLVSPVVVVEGERFLAIMLNLVAVPLHLILGPVSEAKVQEDAVTAALDAIFRGYPVGLPAA
jgi:hypothetical protein